MRSLPILAAALALIVAMLPIQAGAQNATAELVRKARAGEKDNGFCAASNLEKVTFDEMKDRASRLLTQSDAVTRITWAVSRGGEVICFHFTFGTPAPREGKKCRTTESYACQAGGGCLVLKNDFICEVSPGQWD